MFMKHFLVENFYCCDIISSKTGLNKKFPSNILGQKIFTVAKSIPWKHVPTKNFHQNLFGQICLWLQYPFHKNRFEPNKFVKFFFCRKFLWCKIISSKTGSHPNFSLNLFVTFFIAAISFPGKQVWTKNFHQKWFSGKMFMVAKSFPRNQVSTKKFLSKIFYCCKFVFLEKGLAPESFI